MRAFEYFQAIRSTEAMKHVLFPRLKRETAIITLLDTDFLFWPGHGPIWNQKQVKHESEIIDAKGNFVYFTKKCVIVMFVLYEMSFLNVYSARMEMKDRFPARGFHKTRIVSYDETKVITLYRVTCFQCKSFSRIDFKSPLGVKRTDTSCYYDLRAFATSKLYYNASRRFYGLRKHNEFHNRLLEIFDHRFESIYISPRALRTYQNEVSPNECITFVHIRNNIVLVEHVG